MKKSQLSGCIFSVGYGNRSFEAFSQLLNENGIKYLIDVRTSPYSKFNPDFTRDVLEKKLQTINIRYVYMGDLIGGLPRDRDCYSDEKVDYDKCRNNGTFITGITRLITALEKQLTIAIMCSEGKPHECHRSKLLGEMLKERGIELLHIDEEDRIVTQTEVMDRITKGQLALFGEMQMLTSKKRYIRSGLEEAR